MNLFPRNKSFIYNFTSMNSNTVGDTPEDCTIILPPLPYYQECDYYEVECIGFYINYESLDISAIPFNGLLSSPYRRLAVIGVKAWFDSILLYIALYCGCIVYRIYTV